MSRKLSEKGRRLIIQIPAIVLLTLADLGVKKTVQAQLKPIGCVAVLRNIFELTYTENTGAAWGMMSGKQTLLSIIVALVLSAMTVYLFITKEKSKLWHTCLALIISGGAANLVDRMINGFVTDYFRFVFIDFPVFNLADCFIVVGCIVLIIYLVVDLIGEVRKKKTETGENHGNS